MGCGLTFIAWNVRLDDFMSNYFNHWIYVSQSKPLNGAVVSL